MPFVLTHAGHYAVSSGGNIAVDWNDDYKAKGAPPSFASVELALYKALCLLLLLVC